MFRKLFSILSIASLLILGQKVDEAEFCETYLTNEQIRYELNAGFPQPLISPNLSEKIVLSINAIIVRTNSGRGGISEPEVYQAVNQLNNNFLETGISFEVCNFNYVDKSRFFRFNRADENLLTKYNADSTINIYFVEKILGMEEGNVCGYTYYPTKGLNHLVLSNNCIGNGTTLSHEMGHFFGLYHTHEEKFGTELVSGSNCISAGDLICDTSADPGLQFSSVNQNCEYIGLALDPAKMVYSPPVNNLMSYSRKMCRRTFTLDQADKMRITYHIFKDHLKKLDFSFTAPDPLVVRGQSLDLKAEGGASYLWNTGDTTNTITVQPDSSQLYNVYIFTPSGCILYKEYYAEVIGDDILTGPSLVCRGDETHINLRGSKSSLKYQLKNEDELIGEPLQGNDSTLTFVVDSISRNSTFTLLIIDEMEEKVLESNQKLRIETLNAPSEDFTPVLVQDSVCQGRSAVVKIPGSKQEVAYQLVENGKPLFKPVWGTGDTISLVTTPVDSVSTYDIRIFNDCNSLTKKNAFTVHTIPTPELKHELYAEAREVTKGASTRIIISNSDPNLQYQLVSGNKFLSKKLKGTGNELSFRTGIIQQSSDFCVYIYDQGGCRSFMSDFIRIEVKTEAQLQVAYEENVSPKIRYQLNKRGQVHLSIQEMIGRKAVYTMNKFQSAGNYELDLDELNLPPKLYIVIFSIDGVQNQYKILRLEGLKGKKPDDISSFNQLKGI